MRYEVVEDRNISDTWRAEASDDDSEGECYSVVFYGLKSRQLAEEYAEWKNSTADKNTVNKVEFESLSEKEIRTRIGILASEALGMSGEEAIEEIHSGKWKKRKRHLSAWSEINGYVFLLEK